MKTLKLPIALLMGLFMFSSCDLIEDELDALEIKTSLIHEESVSAPASYDQNVVLRHEVNISLDNNTSLEGKLDQIETIEISKMTVEFADFSGDANSKVNMKILFDGVELADLNDVLLLDSSLNSQVYELGSPEILSLLADRILEDKSADLEVIMAVNTGQYNADFDLKLSVQIKTSVLNLI